MKPYPFEYTRVSSLEQAVTLLHREEEPRIIAGGQSLMPILAMRLAAPSRLIDIGALSALRGIERRGEVLRIGALVRHAEVMASAEVAEAVPLLARAITHVAHPAVRNRGTFGGSVCLADPAAELPAVCTALGATFEVFGRDGLRTIPAREFFLDIYETALAPDEILVAAQLPVACPKERFGFEEIARRHGDFAIVGLAVRARIEDAAFADLDLCFFGASPRPVLARNAARALIGREFTAEAELAAIAALAEDLDPQEDAQADAAMRLHLAGVLLKRRLAEVAGKEAEK
ncbi:FAD binding domain-containing protein [Salipiger abyssi]|uniref:Carbon-monoxide dehydrogenase medium subunit n=1 Tax=Salipiger abyssi TaxID=1250539 RepID=A0A1P8UW33_9RHOB|nr:xanthine dehydrogenase family protein subunit M [Salipiger abyssi]APZ53599.1 carbon-monoxide dehydrogenase medium subunit [Salipiger abyssi]